MFHHTVPRPLSRLGGLALCALLASGAAAQQKRVYIGPDDHTDYWWSGTEDDYRDAFLDTLDYYLDLADATQGNPPEFQSRWNCDGSFWMWTYQKHRTAQQFQRLMDRVADGHISVPLNGLCVSLGGAPTEAILRGMYYPGHIERQHGVRFRLAYTMENQTHPYGLWALWAGSGARYSWKGICGCSTQVSDAWDREHDIYWAVGPDGSRVLVKWNSMLWGNQSMGGYAEARDPADVVTQVTVNAPFNGFEDRYPYDVVGCFGKGWDDLQTQTDEFVTVAMNMTDPTRQVIVSNEEDFFVDFEAAYGAQIPEESHSFGNEWDLNCAALAETSARIKRAVERLRTAEALATLVALHDPAFLEGRQAARDLAWMNLGIYWEHDFGMDGFGDSHPWVQGRIDWQNRITGEIEDYVDALHADAVQAFGRLVAGGGAAPRFYVFNPLSWARRGHADIVWTGALPVHVVEVGTQQEVPAQVLAGGGDTVLRIMAEGVPSVGYRVYEVRNGAGAGFSDAATISDPGPGPTTVSYAVASDDRDAGSVDVGPGPHEVRVSGYNPPADHNDYVSNDFEEETAAFAFALDVPPGATVTQAHITVRAQAPSSPSPSGAMAIQVYDVDDTAPFTNGPLGDLLGHHAVLPQTVSWLAPSWPAGTLQVTPDLAALVQAHIDRPGYAPGQHIGLVVTEGTLESGRFYGWEDYAAGGDPPQLTVSYLPPGAAPGGTGDDLLVDNGLFAVRVTPRGALASLIDHTRGDRQFAQSVGGRVLNDLGPSPGALTVESSGPVSVTLRASAAAPLAHTSRITLFRDSPFVDVVNEIEQNFDATHTWSFGFNLVAPETRHEEVGAILRARLVEDGGHYAASNSRYDWLTLNHFADMTAADGVGVTLSNADCYFMKLGNSSTTVLDTVTPQIAVLAGGRVHLSSTGLPDQGGANHFTQRLALTTHDAYDPAAAMRFSLEHNNRLQAGWVTAETPQFPSHAYSALSIDEPDVLLWALKPAEEGIAAGIVARLWNLSDAGHSAALHWAPSAVEGAHVTTHIETDDSVYPVSDNGISADFAPQQLRTFRLLAEEPVGQIPAASAGGLVVLVLLLGAGGALILRRRLRAWE